MPLPDLLDGSLSRAAWLPAALRASGMHVFKWSFHAGGVDLRHSHHPYLKLSEGASSSSNTTELVPGNVVERDRDRWRAAVQMVKAGRAGSYHVEYRVVQETGEQLWLSENGYAELDERGELASIAGLVQDLSSRGQFERQLNDYERRFNATFENAAIGIAHVGLDGRWIAVNREICQITGYAAHELIGHSFTEITVQEDIEPDWSQARRLISGEISNYAMEKRYIRQDGGVVPILLTVSLVRGENGAPAYFISVVQDITERKRAEEASSRLAAVVTSSSDAIISKTLDGIVTSWNRAAEQVFGYTADEMIGESIVRLIPPDRRDEEAEILARIRRGEDINRYEAVRMTKKGRAIDVSLSISPIVDSHGKIIGASKIARDITSEKLAADSLRASEERFQKFMAYSPLAAWIVDERLRVRYASPGFQRMFFAVDDIGNRPLVEVIAPSFRDMMQRVASFPVDQRAGETIERAQSPDGSLGHYLVIQFPMFIPPGERLWGGMALDVSEMKQAEQALRDAGRQKDEFLAMLAHELRNPLAAISNSAQVLKMSGMLPEELHFARDIIDRQMQQMTRIVDDLLEVSRITRGTLELRKERTNLTAIMDRAIETSRPQIDAKGHELRVQLPEHAPLFADVTRLAQAFSNLLNNAAKYSEPAGLISIAAEVIEEHVRIAVKDSGTGIPPTMLGKIFDLFVQVDRTLERSQGGLGIGLTLVKQLVELHGGSVEAHSEGLGRGSEFIVRLPLNFSGGMVDAIPVESSLMEPPAPLRVLVVDDNRGAADTLTLLLQLCQHETRTAYDGLEALQLARNFQPQVVLLDIGLPKLNGYDTARSLRQLPGGDQMMLVAVTGWGQEDDRRRSREAGFDYHLVKPVGYADLQQLFALKIQPPSRR